MMKFASGLLGKSDASNLACWSVPWSGIYIGSDQRKLLFVFTNYSNYYFSDMDSYFDL